MAGAALALGISLPVAQQVVPHGVIHDALGGAEAAAHVTTAGDGGGWSAWGTGIATTAQSTSNCPKKSAPTIRDGFPQPRYLESQNGRLSVKLRAQLGPTEIGGQTYESTTYNGEYPGPTLVVCPGDVMKVNVRNALNPADYQPRR